MGLLGRKAGLTSVQEDTRPSTTSLALPSKLASSRNVTRCHLAYRVPP